METYKNIGGDSGVIGFEIGPDYIKVQFEKGPIYLYNHIKPGVSHVARMKSLALGGQGLNEYIVEKIGKNFHRKFSR